MVYVVLTFFLLLSDEGYNYIKLFMDMLFVCIFI